MSRILIVIILTLSFNCFSQTQAEMNKEVYAEFNKADKELNKVYKQILAEYKTDTIFLESLKKSQRIWIKFRDAELEMKYPNYSDKNHGTIHPTCRAFYLMELTKKRAETLRIWLNGIEEGDVCIGSVKMKNNTIELEKIDLNYIQKSTIEKDSTIWIRSNMKLDHRIFGYKKPDTNSEKLILLSIFTNEVKNNPFNCKYGSYYETSGMENMNLKYLSSNGDYIKVGILKNGLKIDEVYMEDYWFEFEE